MNNKIYIGKHQTKNLNDDYMGSGKLLNISIDKHGIKNFKKEILYIFDNKEDMDSKEKELVNKFFVSENTNYNLCIGGEGGWSYVNKIRTREQRIKAGRIGGFASAGNTAYITTEFRNKLSKCIKNSPNYENMINASSVSFLGKKHTEETKMKMRKPKNIGENNSQFGTMWIHNIEEKRSKRINKFDKIPTGWIKGRKLKF